jgi:hypothetical protein
VRGHLDISRIRGGVMGRDATNVQVHIYEDCDVDCQAVNVSKTAGDQIEWHSTGQAFTVKFENSPFEFDEFEVPAGRSASSGPVVAGALYATYHYEIRRRDSQAVAADPDVNVKH